MILAFDLDDTLYDELTYVRSGFRAVAQWGAARFGWDLAASADTMWSIMQQWGRGQVFDRWLAVHQQKPTTALVRECLQVYRHHRPDITLWPEADATLTALQTHPCYVVTDGHRVVQSHKVDALGVRPRMRHVYITHRYGLAHAKPSVHCFELMRRRERCTWEELVYVGDNPAKDFVNLNRLGVLTIRVLTGQHRATSAADGFEAQHVIPSLAALPALLASRLTCVTP